MPKPINKNCYKAKELQSLENFYLRKDSKDGHYNQCKDCIKINRKFHYSNLEIFKNKN